MRKWCIYEVKNKITGATYIGQHSYTGEDNNPLVDKYGNRYRGSGKILQLAYKKYGVDNFEITILYRRILKQETADSLEISTISKYRKEGKAEYNIRPGGQLRGCGYKNPLVSKALRGRKQPPELVKKRMATHKKNLELGLCRTTKGQKRDESFRLKCSLNFKFKVVKDETKRKISEAHKGMKLSAETVRKLSESHKGQCRGMHWYTNGILNVRDYTCPEGYHKGMTHVARKCTFGK